jgi:ABC-2 type transport system ATP-binding protein
VSAEQIFDFAELSKRYGRLEALRAVTLKMPGGAIGLLGPNGAGKSTLLKVMLGLLPFDGEARVLGFDVRSDARLLRAKVGYMPERECWIPGMNAVELCGYAAELSGLPPAEAMQRAHATLEFVGLGDKRYQRVDGYSTGMKQRCKLAQAIVHDPKLLLLDEPTNGLDPEGREEMLALIASLPPRTGCSVVLSSHLLPDVERVCERAILLHQGAVVFSGTIDELRSTGTRGLHEVRVKVDEQKMKRALESRGLRVELDGGVLLVENATPEVIFEVAQAEGLQVRHLAPKKLTLESAFVRAVNEAQQ